MKRNMTGQQVGETGESPHDGYVVEEDELESRERAMQEATLAFDEYRKRLETRRFTLDSRNGFQQSNSDSTKVGSDYD